MRPSSRPTFETLEHRTFLSAAPAIDMRTFVGPLLPEVYATYFPANASTLSTLSEAPNLLGEWTGKLKAKFMFFSKSLSFSLNVTEQTDETLTGSITVRGKSFSGTIPYTHDGNEISLSYGEGKLSASLKLTVADAGDAAAGSFRGSGFGFSVKGSVSLDRVA